MAGGMVHGPRDGHSRSGRAPGFVIHFTAAHLFAGFFRDDLRRLDTGGFVINA